MRRPLALLLVAGCNAVFGVKDTSPRDASIDAPFTCPPIGTDLMMSPDLHQVFVQTCLYYAVGASGLATGICLGQRPGAEAQSYMLEAGPRDQPLPIVDSLPDYSAYSSNDTKFYNSLYPSPDGTRLYGRLQEFNGVTTVYNTQRFAVQPDGSWLAADLVGNGSNYAIESNVFRGPTGDRVIDADASGVMTEWFEDGAGGWTASTNHPPADIGITFATNWSLTSDGLRAVFQGTRIGESVQQALYTDRPSLDTWFRPAVPLAGAPPTLLSISEDCARIYVTGLGSVFYIQQQ